MMAATGVAGNGKETVGSPVVEQSVGPIFGYVDILRLNGGGEVEVTYKVDKERVMIGRDHRADIRFGGAKLSRNQCVIQVTAPEGNADSPQIILHNLSTKGTTLMYNKKIEHNQKIKLTDGQKFRILDHEIRWRDFKPNDPWTGKFICLQNKLLEAFNPERKARASLPITEASKQQVTPKAVKTRRRTGEVDMRKAVLQKSFKKSVVNKRDRRTSTVFSDIPSGSESNETDEDSSMDDTADSDDLMKFSSPEPELNASSGNLIGLSSPSSTAPGASLIAFDSPETSRVEIDTRLIAADLHPMMATVYKIKDTKGTPIPRDEERFGDETQEVPSSQAVETETEGEIQALFQASETLDISNTSIVSSVTSIYALAQEGVSPEDGEFDGQPEEPTIGNWFSATGSQLDDTVSSIGEAEEEVQSVSFVPDLTVTICNDSSSGAESSDLVGATAVTPKLPVATAEAVVEITASIALTPQTPRPKRLSNDELVKSCNQKRLNDSSGDLIGISSTPSTTPMASTTHVASPQVMAFDSPETSLLGIDTGLFATEPNQMTATVNGNEDPKETLIPHDEELSGDETMEVLSSQAVETEAEDIQALLQAPETLDISNTSIVSSVTSIYALAQEEVSPEDLEFDGQPEEASIEDWVTSVGTQLDVTASSTGETEEEETQDIPFVPDLTVTITKDCSSEAESSDLDGSTAVTPKVPVATAEAVVEISAAVAITPQTPRPEILSDDELVKSFSQRLNDSYEDLIGISSPSTAPVASPHVLAFDSPKTRLVGIDTGLIATESNQKTPTVNGNGDTKGTLIPQDEELFGDETWVVPSSQAVETEAEEDIQALLQAPETLEISNTSIVSSVTSINALAQEGVSPEDGDFDGPPEEVTIEDWVSSLGTELDVTASIIEETEEETRKESAVPDLTVTISEGRLSRVENSDSDGTTRMTAVTPKFPVATISEGRLSRVESSDSDGATRMTAVTPKFPVATISEGRLSRVENSDSDGTTRMTAVTPKFPVATISEGRLSRVESSDSDGATRMTGVTPKFPVATISEGRLSRVESSDSDGATRKTAVSPKFPVAAISEGGLSRVESSDSDGATRSTAVTPKFPVATISKGRSSRADSSDSHRVTRSTAVTPKFPVATISKSRSSRVESSDSDRVTRSTAVTPKLSMATISKGRSSRAESTDSDRVTRNTAATPKFSVATAEDAVEIPVAVALTPQTPQAKSYSNDELVKSCSEMTLNGPSESLIGLPSPFSTAPVPSPQVMAFDSPETSLVGIDTGLIATEVNQMTATVNGNGNAKGTLIPQDEELFGDETLEVASSQDVATEPEGDIQTLLKAPETLDISNTSIVPSVMSIHVLAQEGVSPEDGEIDAPPEKATIEDCVSATGTQLDVTASIGDADEETPEVSVVPDLTDTIIKGSSSGAESSDSDGATAVTSKVPVEGAEVAGEISEAAALTPQTPPSKRLSDDDLVKSCSEKRLNISLKRISPADGPGSSKKDEEVKATPVKKSRASTKRPIAVSTKKPSVSARKQPVSAKTPSVSARKQSVTAKKPSVSAKAPSVSARKQSVAANKPSVSARKQSASAKKSPRVPVKRRAPAAVPIPRLSTKKTTATQTSGLLSETPMEIDLVSDEELVAESLPVPTPKKARKAPRKKPVKGRSGQPKKDTPTQSTAAKPKAPVSKKRKRDESQETPESTSTPRDPSPKAKRGRKSVTASAKGPAKKRALDEPGTEAQPTAEDEPKSKSKRGKAGANPQLEEFSQVTPLQPKRGRSRKREQTPEAEVPVPGPSKGRGKSKTRPAEGTPVTVLQGQEIEEIEILSSAKPRGRSRAKSVPAQPEPSQKPKQSRRRGKTPAGDGEEKFFPNEDIVLDADVGPKGRRRAGRTKPATSAESDKEAEAEAVQKPTGRGRAVKGKAMAAAESADEVEDVQEEEALVETKVKPKARRRPAKGKAPAAASAETEDEAEAVQNEDVPIDTKVKAKGRGRAGKRTATTAAASAETEDEIETVQVEVLVETMVKPKGRVRAAKGKAPAATSTETEDEDEAVQNETIVAKPKIRRRSVRGNASTAATPAETEDEQETVQNDTVLVKTKGRGRGAKGKATAAAASAETEDEAEAVQNETVHTKPKSRRRSVRGKATAAATPAETEGEAETVQNETLLVKTKGRGAKGKATAAAASAETEDEAETVQNETVLVKTNGRGRGAKGKAAAASAESEDDVEAVQNNDVPIEPKVKPKGRGRAGRGKATAAAASAETEDEVEVETVQSQEAVVNTKTKAKPKGRGRAAKATGAAASAESSDEVEDVRSEEPVIDTKVKPKGRARAVKGKTTAAASSAETEDEVEVEADTKTKAKPKGRGRAVKGTATPAAAAAPAETEDEVEAVQSEAVLVKHKGLGHAAKGKATAAAAPAETEDEVEAVENEAVLVKPKGRRRSVKGKATAAAAPAETEDEVEAVQIEAVLVKPKGRGRAAKGKAAAAAVETEEEIEAIQVEEVPVDTKVKPKGRGRAAKGKATPGAAPAESVEEAETPVGGAAQRERRQLRAPVRLRY